MALYLEGRYLRDYEYRFLNKVEEDIKCLDNSSTDCVLIFPPLISPLRYLLHKFVDEFYYPQLCSFSIGQEDQRIVIVGSTSKIIRCSLPYACIHEKLFSTSKLLEKLSDCICSQRIKLLLVQDIEFATFMSAYKNTKKILEDDISDRKMSKMKENGKAPIRDRHKRPDKQLYVPRALRKTANGNTSNVKDNENIISSHKGETPLKFSQTFVKSDTESLFLKQKENQREDDKTSSSFLNGIPEVEHNMSSLHAHNDIEIMEESSLSDVKDAIHAENSSIFALEEEQKHLIKDDEPCLNVRKHNMYIIPEKKSMEVDSKMNSETFDKLKNHHDSSESLKKGNLSSNIIKKQNDCAVPINTYSESAEDSWEAKFNDEGDCLDPKLVKELCDITGRVDLTVAKGDYSKYQPVSSDTSKGYDNIVELFGFPVEFSTQDLTSAFSAFQSSSYTIKWVDDCHALAIFSSPIIASQALHLSHPFIKVRPLSEGIKESKEKARFCTRMFETYKPRPVTSASLARRLVSGALGLKVNASKEQRDMERNILREAKEKKKLKAKQRQDIWNGIVS